MPKTPEKLPFPTWIAVLIILGASVSTWFILAAIAGDPANVIMLAGRLLQVVGLTALTFYIVVGIVRRLSGGTETPPKDAEG